MAHDLHTEVRSPHISPRAGLDCTDPQGIYWSSMILTENPYESSLQYAAGVRTPHHSRSKWRCSRRAYAFRKHRTKNACLACLSLAVCPNSLLELAATRHVLLLPYAPFREHAVQQTKASTIRRHMLQEEFEPRKPSKSSWNQSRKAKLLISPCLAKSIDHGVENVDLEWFR